MSKQSQVVAYLSTVQQADLQMIYDNVKFSYYHNHKKHLGVLMARMVINKKVLRVSPGVFRLNPDHYRNLPKHIEKDENQTQLF